MQKWKFSETLIYQCFYLQFIGSCFHYIPLVYEFRKLNDADKSGITDSLYKQCPDFELAANAFHMIDDNTLTVYVPYSEEGEELTEELRSGDYSVPLMRKLQRFSVNVPISKRDDIERMGVLKLSDYTYVLPDCSNYDNSTGLVFENKWLDDNLIL